MNGGKVLGNRFYRAGFFGDKTHTTLKVTLLLYNKIARDQDIITHSLYRDRQQIPCLPGELYQRLQHTLAVLLCWYWP